MSMDVLKSLNLGEKSSKEVEFIQATFIDINGIAREKVYPIYKAPNLFEGKEEMFGYVGLFGTATEIPLSIKEHSEKGFQNHYIIPDMSTLKISPWCDDNSTIMVLCNLNEIESKTPWPFNPRLLAKQKINELESIGFKFLCGVDNEFRLFNKTTLEPITKMKTPAGQFLANTTVMPFVRRLHKKLLQQGIEMDNWNIARGMGQLKVALFPYKGIEALDKVWLFREMTKYVAYDMDMMASYMTSPLSKDCANGMYISHSLLRSVDSMNAMQSPDEDGKLSELGQNWLAGLIKHSPALTAFTAPTVNCYRRAQNDKFCSTKASWNYSKRDVAFKVKTSASVNNCNYIEVRTPSSACNIYLAISAMIVAGLDGIKKNLLLNKPGNGDHAVALPLSLKEALDALSNDTVLREGLGEKFVDWYVKAKLECDVEVLKKVNLATDSKESLKEEFEKYIVL